MLETNDIEAVGISLTKVLITLTIGIISMLGLSHLGLLSKWYPTIAIPVFFMTAINAKHLNYMNDYDLIKDSDGSILSYSIATILSFIFLVFIILLSKPDFFGLI